MKNVLSRIFSINIDLYSGIWTVYCLFKKFRFKFLFKGLEENKDYENLVRSNFYQLYEKLLDRDINKNFSIDSKKKFSAAYTDAWFTVKYFFPNSSFEKFTEDKVYDVIFMAGLGAHKQNIRALYNAQFNNTPIVVYEDGFIHSITTPFEKKCPKKYLYGISHVFDNSGIFFDATRPTLLENMLNDKNLVITEEQKQRARNLINKIVEDKISMYNHQPIYVPNIGRPNKKKVLVVDQSYRDASIVKGLVSAKTFNDMLETAIKENPDSDIIVKTHPYTLSGVRLGYFTDLKEHDNIFILKTPINPISLLEYVDEVYGCTTHMGFEALMCGKKVHIFGMPFYAGWGLADEKMSIERRRNKRSLEEVFYIAYILYSRYYNPNTQKECEIEDAINYIKELREEYFTKIGL